MDWLAVMAGGALGAGGRYAVGQALTRPEGFPWGTLTVNLLGGLAMGLLVGWLARGAGDSWRLFLGVGVLGGFTTFSAFGLDTVTLIERGAISAALGYVSVSVVGAIGLTVVGLWLARA